MACPRFSRRRFLTHSAAAVGWTAALPLGARLAAAPTAPDASVVASSSAPAVRPGAFSCVLLGDLHFDRLEHHDLAWVKTAHPGDVAQIENYSRLTAGPMPRLFAAVRRSIGQLAAGARPDGAAAAIPATGPAPVALALQVGDFVEGLCGSEALACRQNEEAVAAVQAAQWGVPFLFAKGNHDITGPGAKEAFARVFLPFLTAERRRLDPTAAVLDSANYTLTYGNAQFVFFDAYTPASLEWLETVAARRTAEHFFLVLHPPVVPYGARATWFLYSSPREAARRQRLLDLLGAQRALVLGGHIHRYAALARRTPRGALAQLAVSSVVGEDAPTPREECATYDEEQVRLEPKFSPASEGERRAVYRAEAPQVRGFAYADLPGHAVLRIDGARVTAQIYAGTTARVWRTVDLTALREQAV